MVCCVSKTGGQTTVHFCLLGFGIWFGCLLFVCLFVAATCGFLNIMLSLFLWKYFKTPSLRVHDPAQLHSNWQATKWISSPAFFLSCCQMTKINHLDQTEPFQRNWEGKKSALYSHVIFFNSLTFNYCTSVQSTEPVFVTPDLPRTWCFRVATALLFHKVLVLYSIKEREMSLPW